MKRIIFQCDWGSNSTYLLNKYKELTPNNEGKFKNIIGTSDIEKADYIIILEGIPNNLSPDFIQRNKNQIICFPREPSFIKQKKNWERYNLKYGFTYENIHNVVSNLEFINKNYDFLSELNYDNNHKTKNLSAVVSSKRIINGHKKRYDFIVNLDKNHPTLCDIYGKGWGNQLGNSYKGELSGYHGSSENKKTKYDGLIKYKYSICIENCKQKNYFTEKFTDSILCWTIPIYYGCPNIADYFPEGCYYIIDIENDSIDKIKEIINNPITEYNINALKQARELILNKYNIWGTIADIINK